jgi:O-antigen ligase
LILTLVLLLKYLKIEQVRQLYVLVMMFFLFYIVIGSIPWLMKGVLVSEYLPRYVTSIILISAVYFWVSSIDQIQQLKMLQLFKYILVIACGFTIFSRFLQPYEVPVGAETMVDAQFGEVEERASGFFENPNEAGSIALYCLVLVAALPSRSSLWRVFLGCVALSALVMTFSKGAMLGFLILSLVFLIVQRSIALALLGVCLISGALLALWLVYDQDLLGLSWDQRQRLADVLNLASGEISARTTTGRSILVEFGLEKIKGVFPWGAGLGEFHGMEGGIRKVYNSIETTRWLGIHNTYLMLLGEGGVIALAMLLVSVCCILFTARRSPYCKVIWGFTIVFLLQMSAGHNVLLLRFSNTALAIAIALAASSRGSRINPEREAFWRFSSEGRRAMSDARFRRPA